MKNGPYEMLIAPEGYPGKRYRDRYAYKHMIVWWQTHNFVPPKGFEIHHKNGNHRDNRIDNLQLMLAKEHRRLHGELKKVPLAEIECDLCGKLRKENMRTIRWKLKKGQKYFFCSQKCQMTLQHTRDGMRLY